MQGIHDLITTDTSQLDKKMCKFLDKYIGKKIIYDSSMHIAFDYISLNKIIQFDDNPPWEENKFDDYLYIIILNDDNSAPLSVRTVFNNLSDNQKMTLLSLMNDNIKYPLMKILFDDDMNKFNKFLKGENVINISSFELKNDLMYLSKRNIDTAKIFITSVEDMTLCDISYYISLDDKSYKYYSRFITKGGNL